MELLIVIGIIAILAGFVVPAFKGFGETEVRKGTTRQLLDDLAYARQKAINERTSVLVLFTDPFENTEESLVPTKHRAYRLYARRSVGDQPGRPRHRYLTDWRYLPDGIVFAPRKFPQNAPPVPVLATMTIYQRPLPRYWVPTNPIIYEYIPQDRSIAPYSRDNLSFFHIAFNPEGRAGYFNGAGDFVEGSVDITGTNLSKQDIILTYHKGSVFYPRLPNSLEYDTDVTPDLTMEPEVVLNHIRINWLTGRASSLDEN